MKGDDAATISRQLAIIMAGLRHIQSDIQRLRDNAEEDRGAYRDEITGLRGDLGMYLSEQAKHGREIESLKKRLATWPIRFNYWLPRSPS